MSGPNPVLTHYYGNEKCAGLAAAAYQVLQSEMLSRDNEKQEQQAAILNEIAHELEEERIHQAIGALQHSSVRHVNLPGGRGPSAGDVGGYSLGSEIDSPLFDKEGMKRLASVAALTGVDMAKKAGIVGSIAGGLVKSPLARKAVGGAALVGTGLLAAKAINRVPQELGRQAGPRTFGSGRFGFNPAFGVNEYGQPQAGTPLL